MFNNATRHRGSEKGIVRDGCTKRKHLHGQGTNRDRPGLDQALAAVREWDTFVVTKLDLLARSVPDARGIADQLNEKKVKLAIGATIYDPKDPMGKMFFNMLATFAEFESDLIRMRTREGMVMVGIPYSEADLSTTQAGGTPYGASHVSGAKDQATLTDSEKTLAIALGKRLGKVTNVLNSL